MTGWPAIAEARRGDRAARVPVRLAGGVVGSVARRHLPALPDVVGADGAVELPADAAALDALNRALHAQGLIAGWRDEAFPVFAPGTRRELLRMERAAARFWGTLTLGAHANGYVADADGRPAALWIAQRSFDKATDPGRFDNLVGGGVPAGQSPWQTLQREGFEEAGLDAACMAGARPGRVLAVDRAVPEGWQHEHLHVFDLALPPGLVPRNQDGEVQGFELLPLPEAVARARGGAMTVDASLATLDFLLRHRLLGPEQDDLEAALGPLVQND